MELTKGVAPLYNFLYIFNDYILYSAFNAPVVPLFQSVMIRSVRDAHLPKGLFMTSKIVTLDELELCKRIALNIAYYRKLSGLTQSELAERINYSDKSVSKWEHAAGVPGIHVLAMLAELFGVTVNDIISENAPLPLPDTNLREKRRVVTCLQLIVAVWLAATAIFAFVMLFAPPVKHPWLAFVVAVPVSCAVYVIFSALWWGHLARLLSVSALAWTTALCVFLYMLDNSFAFLIFMVCAVGQILVLLWYIRGRLADKSRHARRVHGDDLTSGDRE